MRNLLAASLGALMLGACALAVPAQPEARPSPSRWTLKPRQCPAR
jgi:hypothetical protein